jgi:hypothetical protein
MNRASALILGLVLAGCGGSAPAPEPEPAAEVAEPAAAEWTTLFDGTNLDNWNPIGDANWMLADGTVEATSGNGYLVSRESYDDFELLIEFWATDDANSGIFIRCSDGNNITAENSYEVNIYDQRPDPTYRTGGIVNFAPPTAQINAGGQWNTMQIVARGTRLIVTVNGIQTVDVEDGTYAGGPFGLQYGGAGTIRFRNVQIR